MKLPISCIAAGFFGFLWVWVLFSFFLHLQTMLPRRQRPLPLCKPGDKGALDENDISRFHRCHHANQGLLRSTHQRQKTTRRRYSRHAEWTRPTF